MNKAYSKYIITISVLLLNIFVQLVPHLHDDKAFIQSVNHSWNSKGVVHNHEATLNLAVLSSIDISNSSERFICDYDEKCEDDEDSLNSHNKNLSSVAISSFFHTLHLKYFLLKIAKISHFGTSLQKSSFPKLFIVFQVFRI